jgi:ribosomal protein S18 acetylase RimI-like enzyme
MTLDLSYKVASTADVNHILELFKQTSLRLKQEGIEHWVVWQNPPQSKIDEIENACLEGQFYFGYLKEEFVGMFRLMNVDLPYWGKMDDEAYYLHALCVLPKFKGLSIGIEFINKAIELAKSNRIPILRLDCNKNNPVLPSYYEKLGFNKVGEVTMPHSVNNLYELYLD